MLRFGSKIGRKCIAGLVLVLLAFGLLTIQGSLRDMTKTARMSKLVRFPSLDRQVQFTKPETVSPLLSLPTGNKQLTGITTHAQRTRHSTQEVRHIGFLKVHKAASSTMQNIFFRFGLKRNLTFVFTNHPNYFSRRASSHLPLIPPKKRTGYDILCNHGVFNRSIYGSLLPNDTVYLAIVRDPLPLFISSVNYYSQPSQALGYLTRIPGNKLRNLIQKGQLYDRGDFSYTHNAMARDFGFTPGLDPGQIRVRLQAMGDTFSLVLLVEYFEESLILMKRYIGWQLQDIIFISSNVYGKGNNLDSLSPDDLLKFTKRNDLDYQVYGYFYQKFWEQFSAESEDIHDEVLNFKYVLRLVYTFCNGEKAQNTDDPENLTIEASKWTQQFSLTSDDCDYLVMQEQKFITLLRQRQGSELPPATKKQDFRRPQILNKHILGPARMMNVDRSKQ